MKENEARNLVFINVKNVEYFQPIKEWISVRTWWTVFIVYTFFPIPYLVYL